MLTRSHPRANPPRGIGLSVFSYIASEAISRKGSEVLISMRVLLGMVSRELSYTLPAMDTETFQWWTRLGAPSLMIVTFIWQIARFGSSRASPTMVCSMRPTSLVALLSRSRATSASRWSARLRCSRHAKKSASTKNPNKIRLLTLQEKDFSRYACTTANMAVIIPPVTSTCHWLRTAQSQSTKSDKSATPPAYQIPNRKYYETREPICIIVQP